MRGKRMATLNFSTLYFTTFQQYIVVSQPQDKALKMYLGWKRGVMAAARVKEREQQLDEEGEIEEGDNDTDNIPTK